MAYKMVCDQCEKETDKNYARDHASLILDGWKAEVLIVSRHDQVLGTLVLCEGCLREVLSQGHLRGPRWKEEA